MKRAFRPHTFHQWLILFISALFISLFLVLPLVTIFMQAFSKGFSAFFSAFSTEDTQSSIYLTLITACIAVPLNLVFGVAAAWLITRFDFRGKGILLTLIDAPLAVSPVIAGMMLALLYGSHGVFAPVLNWLDLKIIFSLPGIILATTFVTLPYVVRELMPLMLQQGSGEEEAALTLGASGWQTFFWVTLPNIKWGLLYGVILCNARAMGEFGAVSVVSGHIRGETNTMPLQIEMLYNEYNFVGAFAVASLMAVLALFTLIAKYLLERHALRAAS